MKILICGLNGVGKSTLGRALAHRLGYFFLDNEDLFFPKNDSNYLFANQRSRAEVEVLLTEIMETYENLVFSAVRGEYGEATVNRYSLAVVMQAPRSVRLTRVHDRSFARFGRRTEPGGDLWEHEQSFMNQVGSRDESYVTNWVMTLSCPVLFIDGTRPIEENIAYILASMEGICPYLVEQIRLHPSMTPQDMAKLCYQAAHGAEHLLSNLDRARGYFMSEWEAIPANPEIPLVEPISDTVARVNLAPWKAQGRSPEALFELFVATATVSGDGDTLLQDYLDEVGCYLRDHATSVSPAAWNEFMAWYEGLGRPAIHHSDAYRQHEKPAYRIVRRELLGPAYLAD